MTTWDFCTSEAAVAKAGTNVNEVSAAAATMAKWYDEAAGSIELETGKSYADNFLSIPTGVQAAVGDVCSSKIAMKMIAFDTTGYLAREADTLLNVNDGIIIKGIKDLEEFTKIKLKNPST